MKKLFEAIRHRDIDEVREIIEKDPALVFCTAKQPPKKDDGQSPLQVALKTGNLAIADYLLDKGADVNFMESEECCNDWRAPALNDAITAAVMKSRWNSKDFRGEFEIHSTEAEADAAYAILKRMIDKGADVNAKDTSGNTGLYRFCAQARQILPTYVYKDDTLLDDREMTPELRSDLMRICALLVESGADLDYKLPSMSSPPCEFYAKEPLGEILNAVRRR